MEEKAFTIELGLEVQAKQLAEWKSILLPEVYEALYEYATRLNHLAKIGWDIRRGTDLSTYIANYMLGWRN
jgi:hypothetical protein